MRKVEITAPPRKAQTAKIAEKQRTRFSKAVEPAPAKAKPAVTLAKKAAHRFEKAMKDALAIKRPGKAKRRSGRGTPRKDRHDTGITPPLYVCPIGNHLVNSNFCPDHKMPTAPY